MTDLSVKVGEVGERALVDRIIGLVGGSGRGVRVGPGDDGAVVDPGDRLLVLSTDSQHEGIHFQPDWISPRELGRRALAVNVSDLGAMGAEPLWGLAAFALPTSTSLAWAEDVARGLGSASKEFGCAIVGGDVAHVPDRIGLTVTVVGGIQPGSCRVLRSGAQAGDLCWVSGHPGRAAAGRCLLSAGFRLLPAGGVGEIESVERAGAEVSLGEGRDEAASCIGAYLRPQPPVSFGIQVAHDGLATAMLDVSDGLGIDLMRLCRASGVGVDLDLAEVEDRAELRRWEAEGMGSVRDWVLGGGDDYELLGATPPDKADEIHAAAAELGVTLRFLGRFSSASERCRIRAEDGYEPLGIRGWDHFRSSVGSA